MPFQSCDFTKIHVHSPRISASYLARTPFNTCSCSRHTSSVYPVLQNKCCCERTASVGPDSAAACEPSPNHSICGAIQPSQVLSFMGASSDALKLDNLSIYLNAKWRA